MDKLVELINTVGFPIGLSVYLLIRFEKKLEEINKSISKLISTIEAVMDNKK